jgi:hypothetical protein
MLVLRSVLWSVLQLIVLSTFRNSLLSLIRVCNQSRDNILCYITKHFIGPKVKVEKSSAQSVANRNLRKIPKWGHMSTTFPQAPGALIPLQRSPEAACLHQYCPHSKPEDVVMNLLLNVIHAATNPWLHSGFSLHRNKQRRKLQFLPQHLFQSHNAMLF